MSTDPLIQNRRASRRRLNASVEGEPETAPIATNGAGNGATQHGPVFTKAHFLGVDKTLIFPWGGVPLTITYNPNRLTFRLAREMDALLNPADGGDPDPSWLIQRLLTLIIGWDAVVDQETLEPYPLNAETLEGASPEFLFALLKAINEEINPPKSETSFGSIA